MTPFRDLPIRRKVALTVVTTSAIVLLLTASAFMAYEWVTFRQDALGNLKTLGRVIAENSTAALSFNNAADAQETIATLRTEPDIISAAIYNGTGKRIAYYTTAETPPPKLDELPLGGYLFVGAELFVYEPIVQDNRQLGTLMMHASLVTVERRFMLYGMIVLLILLTSSLVAFGLSSRLQRGITQPVQELAATAHTIATRGDYSTRASRYGNDELGALTDAFNQMLDEITEREARLSASEERLRSALSAADMGTWRYYPDRHLSFVDENFRRIYGLPPGSETATDHEMTERIYPEDRGQGWTTHVFQNNETNYTFEYRVFNRDGGLRWVRDRGRIVRRTDGSVDYVTGAIIDITERKLAENEVQRLNADLERRVAQRTAELEQANSELEAFTYSVSHDLRGPLRHISGYAEIIQEDASSQLSNEARTCLGRISHAATRLSQLVDSLLNLSRIGRKQLVLQRMRLDDIVTGALRELEAEMQNRRVEIQRQPLPSVDCDPDLLHIVFVNLLSNALKYSRPREVTIILIGTQMEAHETAVFVRDNGVGFDPRFKDKLFGVFERLHSAGAFEGTGIGLATVERIIHKHGGRIWADSAVDQGATFYFTLHGM